jgi:hypothetical protein
LTLMSLLLPCDTLFYYTKIHAKVICIEDGHCNKMAIKK